MGDDPRIAPGRGKPYGGTHPSMSMKADTVSQTST